MLMKRKLLPAWPASAPPHLGEPLSSNSCKDAPPVFGSVEYIQAQFEDTLPDLARLFSLGYEEIIRRIQASTSGCPGAARR